MPLDFLDEQPRSRVGTYALALRKHVHRINYEPYALLHTLYHVCTHDTVYVHTRERTHSRVRRVSHVKERVSISRDTVTRFLHGLRAVVRPPARPVLRSRLTLIYSHAPWNQEKGDALSIPTHNTHPIIDASRLISLFARLRKRACLLPTFAR